jgi:hypothetical protein
VVRRSNAPERVNQPEPTAAQAGGAIWLGEWGETVGQAIEKRRAASRVFPPNSLVYGQGQQVGIFTKLPVVAG